MNNISLSLNGESFKDKMFKLINEAFENLNMYLNTIIEFISNNLLWSASMFLFILSALIFYLLFTYSSYKRPKFYTNMVFIGLSISLFYFLNIILNPKRKEETVYRGEKYLRNHLNIY